MACYQHSKCSVVRLARHLPVNATELCINYLVCGRRFQSRDQAAAHMGMLHGGFFSKVWFKVSLPSVESVWFLIHNSMSSQWGSMLWSAFLLKKIPEVTHLWMFTPHLYRYTYFDHDLSQRSIVMCQSQVCCVNLYLITLGNQVKHYTKFQACLLPAKAEQINAATLQDAGKAAENTLTCSQIQFDAWTAWLHGSYLRDTKKKDVPLSMRAP